MRSLARELVNRMGSQQRVAEQLGIAQPSLSSILTRKSGFGPATARQLVALYNGKDPSHDAVDKFLDHDVERARDAYPNRAVVIDCARRLGVSEAAIDALRRTKLAEEDDAPSVWWLRRLLRYEDTAHDTILANEPTIRR